MFIAAQGGDDRPVSGTAQEILGRSYDLHARGCAKRLSQDFPYGNAGTGPNIEGFVLRVIEPCDSVSTVRKKSPAIVFRTRGSDQLKKRSRAIRAGSERDGIGDGEKRQAVVGNLEVEGGGTFSGNAYAKADVTITGAAVTGCARRGNGNGNGNGKEKCNQGVGNGPEACDPGNSNHRHGSNDEDGGTPGNPGRKGGR